MKKCNFCGNENNDNCIYCVSCGMRIEDKPTKTGEDLFFQTDFSQKIKKENTASMTLGIISLGITIGLFYLVFIAQITAIILGILACIKGFKDINSANKNKCILGIIIGVISCLISIIFIVAIITGFEEIFYESGYINPPVPEGETTLTILKKILLGF